MKLSEHKELKKEILALPLKEKDKLLLRLVAKDKVLTEHLHFLLLEDEHDLEDRVAALKELISAAMADLKKEKKLNAKEVLTGLRKLVKSTNHFVRVTKAPFEEVELKIFLFNHTIIEFKSRLFSSYKNYEILFANYFVKQILLVLRKLDKLHEDLQFDLKEDTNALLNKVYVSNFAKTGEELNLPREI